MKTVDKAMHVLNQFSFDRTEVGLSELSRLSGLDKAATRRLLVALSNHGFVEQLSDTKQYRLGCGFLRLARIREATVPLTQAAQEVIDWLFVACDETTHISVPSSESMTTIAHRIPRRGNIINIEPTQGLPYHATGSGLSYLAAATPDTREILLTLKRLKSTPSTIVSKAALLKKIKQTQDDGYAQTRNTFEDGVASISMAFFLDQVDPGGTISIALPDEKMTEAKQRELLPLLSEAIERLETAIRGSSAKKI